MRQNKGFTLIELLGVIIVLAIVALISMPLVLDAVSKSAKGAYEESLRNVISATDIYIASDEFSGMPEEGIEITSDVIKMKNKRFTSGIVFRNADGELELSNVSDGTYCGGGTLKHLVIIKSSCDTLDVSNPTLSIATNLVTSSAITVAATADDPESGIASYQYSKDNGATWTSKQTSSTYEFTGLNEGTTYDIKIKVYNNNVSYVLTTTKSLTVTTVDIPAPTYGVNTTDWSQSKTVTITYPERKEGYVYEYSLDEASTWTEVSGTDTTKVLTFNANGNVIARVSDGTNIVSGTTYEVTNINTTPPVITVNPPLVTMYQGFTYQNAGVTATDDIEGDITARIVTTGTVDTGTLGTYTLTYNVTDNAGNTAISVIRNVNVLSATFTFTNANQTGTTGPSQSQINSVYSGTNLSGNVTVSSGVQLWTVPQTGTYRIEAYGAQGGSTNYTGGKGARIRGDFSLTAGQQITILVGQVGADASRDSYTRAGAGGGGGTFVYRSNEILVIAGGGGGATNYQNGVGGSTSAQGAQGGSNYYGNPSLPSAGSPGFRGSMYSTGYGGSNGSVGSGGSGQSHGSYIREAGGGGGTFNTSTRTNIGGSGGSGCAYGGNGGFGGGGGGGGVCHPGCYNTYDWAGAGAGGGGGYTGGNGGNSAYDWCYGVQHAYNSGGSGGGGGSYNNGSNPSNSSSANSGHGKVIITIIP